MRVGIVGKRGLACVSGVRSVAGVAVTAFCDPDPSTHDEAAAQEITDYFVDFASMLDRVDGVVIATPMHLHAPQSIEALARGKHVLSEVTAAVTLEECLELKRAVRSSSGTYSFAENYCYFKECLLARELARAGRFGELYFGEGNYVHEVRFMHRDNNGQPTWRTKWQVGLRGNTYCTHELGPLMRCFTAADPSIRITSVACFGSGSHTEPTLPHDDCTLTLVQLSNGGLIKLHLDMLSNRPHRIGYTLQGTFGVLETDERYRVWLGENRTVGFSDPQRQWKDLFDLEPELPDDLRGELSAAESSGHGGADYFVGRRFAQTMLGAAPEIGIAEAVEWTMVGLLSQDSILNGGVPVSMPAWVYETP